uniref:Uncharacterized protein n=1 Tax=Cacopsylla melanoneura TaxID=428564 RepID=A0A8D9AUY7_9HEMI
MDFCCFVKKRRVLRFFFILLFLNLRIELRISATNVNVVYQEFWKITFVFIFSFNVLFFWGFDTFIDCSVLVVLKMVQEFSRSFYFSCNHVCFLYSIPGRTPWVSMYLFILHVFNLFIILLALFFVINVKMHFLKLRKLTILSGILSTYIYYNFM